jgi:pimeloyl-ACP methyl ester carboxylesterase
MTSEAPVTLHGEFTFGEDVFHQAQNTVDTEFAELPAFPSCQEPETNFESEAIPSTPPPSLSRPVLFVHGFNSSEKGFKTLKKYLTSGKEPQNTYGGLIHAGDRDELRDDGMVFELRFSKPWNPIEKNADELKEAIENISRRTGYDEIDVVTHSMGGLDTRKYLMNGDEKIHRLVMVAPPNHGAYAANVELHLREEHGMPIHPPTDNPDVVKTLHELSYVSKKEGDPGNTFLYDLNKDWNIQKSRAEITIIAGSGTPTLVPGGMTRMGDDLVTEESARMPDTEFISIYGPMKDRHGKIMRDPKVQELIGEILTREDK